MKPLNLQQTFTRLDEELSANPNLQQWLEPNYFAPIIRNGNVNIHSKRDGFGWNNNVSWTKGVHMARQYYPARDLFSTCN